MIEFNRKRFKKNAKYILGIVLIINILLLISVFGSKITGINELEQDLEESGESNVSKLVINEIASNNISSVSDSTGDIYDWIELYNGTSKDIDLSGYTLSDDPTKLKWAFKDTIIKSKEYLIVYLSGKEMSGLYANFALTKKGGEKIVLRNNRGKVVDIVETVKVNKNASIARTLDGKWQVVKSITPGYVNTEEGYTAYLKSLEDINDDLIINEVLVRNGGQFKDNFNDYSGYIEIKNNTNTKISLKEYSLSNSVDEPVKWKLPDITLNGGDIILIYTSGRDIKDNILHTSFKLDSKNGVVILSKNGMIVQKVEYSNLANGYALEYQKGEYLKTGVLSGGFENDINGIEKFAKEYEQTPKSLIINEAMSSNYEYLPNNSGNYYDWIELKNNSSETINLKDYYLTTTLNDTEMYELPDYELKPGNYYVIMASGDTNLTNNSYHHANFKISNIESIYLTSKGKVIDSMFIADLKTGYSFGRGSYGFIYMEKPTPNSNNNGGLFAIASRPIYTKTEGVYNDVTEVAVELDAPGTIYYTLNGDTPTTRSNKYTGPITLTKTTVLRSLSVENGKYISDISNASYIINENHTMPVMSVSIDNSSFRQISNNAWSDIEKAANATLFDGDKTFNVPCGFKLFGGSTRGLDKKSFALKFKKKYGLSELHYQVFENRDNSIYNSLVLRSGSQDYNVSMIRDPVLTSLMEDSDVDVQAMRPVILYINGNYWGIYFIVEKVDEDFIAAHYNVNPESTNLMVITGENVAGDRSGYDSFIKFLRTHDMSRKDNYDYIKTVFDIDNTIEYWIAETYLTNNDIINCKFFSHPDIKDGKWRFIFFDLDYAMYYPQVNYYTFMQDSSGMGTMKVDPTIPKNLFKNAEFKKDFVAKLSEMLKTTWNQDKIIERINEYHDLLEPEMPRNIKRWGSSMATWEKEVEKMRDFARRRNSYLLNQTKSFFNLSNEEMKVFYEQV